MGAGFPSVATCVSRAVLCASAVPAICERDAACPISTGVKDTACPLSTGGGGGVPVICGQRAQVRALSSAAACRGRTAASLAELPSRGVSD